MAVLVAVTVLAALLYTAVGMPPFDDPNVPTMNEVPQAICGKVRGGDRGAEHGGRHDSGLPQPSIPLASPPCSLPPQ